MTLSVTMPIGSDELEFPLGQHVNKSGKPYWVFDAFGAESSIKAMKFGCAIDGTEGLEIPALLAVTDGTTEVLVELKSETVVAYKDKVTTYADRRKGEAEFTLPGEARPRPVRVTISRKHEDSPWNMRISVTNAGGSGGPIAKVSLKDLMARSA